MQEDRKPRVLVADDNSTNRLLFCRVLKNLGCQVIGEAVNGDEAIRLFSALKPDLLLLDILMPGKSGTEVLKEVMTSYPDANVIMLSSIMDDDIIAKCLDSGARGFLQKSAMMSDIKKVISDVLNSLN